LLEEKKIPPFVSCAGFHGILTHSDEVAMKIFRKKFGGEFLLTYLCANKIVKPKC